MQYGGDRGEVGRVPSAALKTLINEVLVAK